MGAATEHDLAHDGVVTAAMSQLPDLSVLVFDVESRVLASLGPLAQRPEFCPELLLGRRGAEALPPEAWAVIGPLCAAALTGQTATVDALPHAGEGNIELTGNPVWRDGQIDGASVSIRDVTALRATQAELNRVVGEFESFVGTSIEGHYRLSPDGTVLWASPSMATLTGKPMSEIIGIKARAVVHPDDVHRRDAAMAQLLATQAPQTFEVRGEHADGTWHWFEGTLRGLFDSDGRLLELHITTRDVSQRRADEDLRRQWQLSFEATSRGIALLDPHEQRIVQVNPAFERMHGGTATDLTGRSLLDLVDPGARAGVVRHVQRADSETFVHFESEHRRLDGSVFPVDVEFVSPCDADGRLLYRLAYLVDLTQQKAQAAAEQEARDLFAATIDQAPIGMCLVSTSGRFLRVNAALCRLLQRSEAELLATDFQQLTHPDDLGSDLSLLQETLDGNRDSYEMHKRYLLPSGAPVPTWLSVRLIRHPDGKPAHFISQIVDLTRAHAAETRLRVMEDRHRIATDLHDHVVQGLFAAGLSLQMLETVVGAGPHAEQLNRSIDEIDATIARIRSTIYGLRASGGGTVAVRDRVHDVMAEVAPLFARPPAVFFAGPLEVMVSSELLEQVVDLLRDTLSEIGRQGEVEQVEIALSLVPEVSELRVEVTENGATSPRLTWSASVAQS
jgi:PAS domain S-box-containing protein